MSGSARFWTMIIRSGQLLASMIHSNFNIRNKIIQQICNPSHFYLPTWETIYTALYFSIGDTKPLKWLVMGASTLQEPPNLNFESL